MNRTHAHERRHRPDASRTAVAPPRLSHPVPADLAEWMGAGELAMRITAYGLAQPGQDSLASSMAQASTYPMGRTPAEWRLESWKTYESHRPGDPVWIRLRGQDDRGGLVELAVTAAQAPPRRRGSY